MSSPITPTHLNLRPPAHYRDHPPSLVRDTPSSSHSGRSCCRRLHRLHGTAGVYSPARVSARNLAASGLTPLARALRSKSMSTAHSLQDAIEHDQCYLPIDEDDRKFAQTQSGYILKFQDHPNKDKTQHKFARWEKGIVALRIQSLWEWYGEQPPPRRSRSSSPTRRSQSQSVVDEIDPILGFPASWLAEPKPVDDAIAKLDLLTKTWESKKSFIEWRDARLAEKPVKSIENPNLPIA